MIIEQINAREIFDSRGIPTIECMLVLSDGACVTSSVPSGKSKGAHEAKELRDEDSARLFGMGVQKAIGHIHDIIAPALIGRIPSVIEMDIKMLDIDGTEDKSRLGANAMLAVSIAVLKAQAYIEGLEPFELIAHLCDYESVSMPFGMFNIINGGAHAQGRLSIQEFMIMPIGVDSFHAAIEVASNIFHTLVALLRKKNIFYGIGDEGGYSAQFSDEIQALDLLMESMELVGARDNTVLALDVAATQLYDPKANCYQWGEKCLSAEQLIAHYQQLSSKYPLFSIEDGLAESDWNGWIEMTKQLGDKLQLVGDDLFVTNPRRIIYGIERGAANAVVIKPNQVGTVTETLQAVKLCKDYNMNIVVSHRSGETNDTFIVDVAVGTSAGQIKAGGLCRGERMAKYNELLRVEDDLINALLLD